MEKTCENSEVKNDLFVRVKTTKTSRFRNQDELQNTVTMVAVEVNEANTETIDALDLNIHIQSRAGSKVTKADAGKTA